MSSQTPFFSIVIPMYNRATLVVETLDTVLAQTYVDWECVIVDDGSTDDSREVVQKYCEEDPRFKLFRRPETRAKGPSACRNYGFENSCGNYILFFDSDDLLHPDFLRAVFERLDGKPETEYAVLPYDTFTRNPLTPSQYKNTPVIANRPHLELAVIDRIRCATPAFLWKSSFLTESKPLWNESRSCFEDYDFGRRMLCNAKNGIWLDMPPMIHVRISNSDSLSASRRKMNGEKVVADYISMTEESYRLCEEKNLLSPSLQWCFLRSVLSHQIKFSVLMGKRSSMRSFYLFMRRHDGGSLSGWMARHVSWICYQTTPLIHALGTLTAYIPFFGKTIRLIKNR